MKHLIAIVVAGLMMVGCASKPASTQTSTATAPVATPVSASVQKFSCNIGLDVTIKHLGNDQIELTTSPDVKRAVLSQAPSGSGERYVTNTGLWGNGGEWHQKGGEAHFSYVGVHGGQPKSATCTAQ